MTRRMVLALLALVGAFLSAYLTLYKLGYVGQLACAIGSCEQVQSSRWSMWLGIPVATWGVAFYLAVLITAVAGTQPRFADALGVSRLLVALTGWGLLFSAYLTAMELFVIHAICLYCVTSALIVTAMFVVAALDWRARGAIARGAPARSATPA